MVTVPSSTITGTSRRPPEWASISSSPAGEFFTSRYSTVYPFAA
jgi:hypothetical protein